MPTPKWINLGRLRAGETIYFNLRGTVVVNGAPALFKNLIIMTKYIQYYFVAFDPTYYGTPYDKPIMNVLIFDYKRSAN